MEATKTLSAVEFAARKLLDALTTDAETDAWAEATDPARGLRYKVDNGTTWYKFKNHHFRCKRKRVPVTDRYGDRERLNQFNQARNWKDLLDALVQNHLAQKTRNARSVVLVNNPRSDSFLCKLKLTASALKKVRGLEQIA